MRAELGLAVLCVCTLLLFCQKSLSRLEVVVEIAGFPCWALGLSLTPAPSLVRAEGSQRPPGWVLVRLVEHLPIGAAHERLLVRDCSYKSRIEGLPQKRLWTSLARASSVIGKPPWQSCSSISAGVEPNRLCVQKNKCPSPLRFNGKRLPGSHPSTSTALAGLETSIAETMVRETTKCRPDVAHHGHAPVVFSLLRCELIEQVSMNYHVDGICCHERSGGDSVHVSKL